ncbi:MAG: alpha/beta hydrolase [Bacteroidota bacterium]
MKHIEYQDIDLAYSSQGRGKAVVFLHGFCADSTVWEDYKQDLLEEKYRVICIDLPGFGRSGVIQDCSVAQMADAVKTVLDELHVEEGILIGHSMGGYVGLAFAEKYPEFLLGLGLFHSHPFADSAEKIENRQSSIRFIERQGHQLYVKQLIPKLFPPKFVRGNSFLIDKMIYRASKYDALGIINGLKAMMQRPDRAQVLKDVEVPVLFIVGALDEAIPHDYSIEQTHLPEVAHIHILDKVAHMGMLEAQKQTQVMMRKFVEYCLS